jgi:hypothetical protein
MSRAYQDWHDGRRDFHQKKSRGEVKGDDWQKDYFQGRDAVRHETAPDHMTRVAPPPVHYSAQTNPKPAQIPARKPEPSGSGRKPKRK